jgi:hypothetical protein
LWSLGIFLPVLVFWTSKNLATLLPAVARNHLKVIQLAR